MADVQDVERELGRLLSSQARPRVLAEAMRWAVEGGGKRIRPRICLAAAVAVGGSSADALLPACAVELLHSYTLVHDDLPAMDNDAERRGRPSVWAKFGEANAILAGDALQALAFTALAQAPERRPGARAQMLAFFADCALGVVRGQVEDIASGAKDVPFIYEHKTADLFMAAAVTGALAGGGDDASVEKLRLFAYATTRPSRSCASLPTTSASRSSTRTTCSTTIRRSTATRRRAACSPRRMLPLPPLPVFPATRNRSSPSPATSLAARARFLIYYSLWTNLSRCARRWRG